MTDAHGRITVVNGQTERLVGYSREELQHAPFERLVPERWRTDPSELVGRRKDGTEFPIEITESKLDTGEGPLVVRSIRDVTERKSACRRAEGGAFRPRGVRDKFSHRVTNRVRSLVR